jgi:hypothetical protein
MGDGGDKDIQYRRGPRRLRREAKARPAPAAPAAPAATRGSASPAAAAMAVMAAIVATVPMLFGPPAARAQESANDELDRCMRDAAVTGAVTGGGVGGLVGALLGDSGRERVQRALGGAAIGATVGAISAWHLSYKSCSARFATASSLITDEYAACAQRHRYQRSGVVVGIEGESMAPTVRGGERVVSDVRYHVLTPDPRDVPIVLQRRFQCRDEKGRFNDLASPVERITVGSGCHVSRGSFPLPREVPAEQECRMEVSLQAEGQQRSHVGTFRIMP